MLWKRYIIRMLMCMVIHTAHCTIQPAPFIMGDCCSAPDELPKIPDEVFQKPSTDNKKGLVFPGYQLLEVFQCDKNNMTDSVPTEGGNMITTSPLMPYTEAH